MAASVVAAAVGVDRRFRRGAVDGGPGERGRAAGLDDLAAGALHGDHLVALLVGHPARRGVDRPPVERRLGEVHRSVAPDVGHLGFDLQAVGYPVARGERREQRGRAVADVVVGVPLGLPRRHRQERLGAVQGLFHRLQVRQGLVDPQVGGVGLGGRGHVGGRLGQEDSTLGHADLVDPIEGRLRQHQGHGIGVAHVLRGADQDPAGDEEGILPRGDEPGQVVEGGVGIRPAHALDKGRGRVAVTVLATFCQCRKLLFYYSVCLPEMAIPAG